MKIVCVTLLEQFDFWDGAVANASLLTSDEFRQLEDILEELYPEGIEDVALNDLFWFDFEDVCKWLGLDEKDVRERDVDC